MGISGTNSNIYSDKNIGYPSYNAVQINMSKPTVNAPSAPVIYDYPQSDGQIYYPPVNSPKFTHNTVTRTPSGVKDFDNYSEIDKNGKEIASIKYSSDNGGIVQKITTEAPDGVKLEKTLKNSPNFKQSHILIKDKDGKVLLSKEKTYEKIDDNSARSVVNGETYNISGLSGNVLSIEHNGETTKLDLDKMLNQDVKILQLRVSAEKLPIRNEKITEEEKQKLYNRIKSLGGDDLVRLSKSVETLQFLDEKSIESFFLDNGKTLLLSPNDWENTHLVTEHELGHAINHSKTVTNLSEDKDFISVREYEKQNFNKYADLKDKDKFFADKFINGNPDLAWADVNYDLEAEQVNLRDETFAECYNNLNTMDIIHYGEEVLPERTMSLFKYMPRTMVEAERLSQI